MAQLGPFKAQPAHVLLDGIDVLGVFLGRVGVVEAQVHRAAKLLADAEVQVDGLGVAKVQIAVGLGREAGADGGVPARGQVLSDDLADEVVLFQRVAVNGNGSRGHAAGQVGG